MENLSFIHNNSLFCENTFSFFYKNKLYKNIQGFVKEKNMNIFRLCEWKSENLLNFL